VPVSTTKPSVDQMLRRPTPADPGPQAVDAGGTAGESGDGAASPVPAPAPAGPTTAALREWARANGHDVSDSGPVPKTVREAYDAAHAG
jgi:hypothetical protein